MIARLLPMNRWIRFSGQIGLVAKLKCKSMENICGQVELFDLDPFIDGVCLLNRSGAKHDGWRFSRGVCPRVGSVRNTDASAGMAMLLDYF